MVTVVQHHQLTDYLERLFRAAGTTRGGARVMASAYVEADLRGIPGHGCRLVPTTLGKLRAGRLSPRPAMTVLHRSGAVHVLDAGLAPGPLAVRAATTTAGNLARHFGIGFTAVRRSGHAGALGIGAGWLAERGLIGMVAAQTSSPSVALLGGTGTPVLGNSAIAVGVPGPERPVLIDLAAGAMSWGRVHQHARASRVLPDGVALDRNGRPTRCPSAATALLPAGERGQGLAIVLELLVGTLTGSSPLPCGHDGRGVICLAIDPTRAGHADRIAAAVEAVAHAVHEQGARMPGDRGRQHRATAQSRGIELNDDDLAALILAGRPGVPAPPTWTASTSFHLTEDLL
jgi:LDH2 family malate/lactate/ureidoglycolate dehydrogenase